MLRTSLIYFFYSFVPFFKVGVPSTPPTRIDGTDGEIGYSQCQSPGAPPFGVGLCLIPPHHVINNILHFIEIVKT